MSVRLIVMNTDDEKLAHKYYKSIKWRYGAIKDIIIFNTVDFTVDEGSKVYTYDETDALSTLRTLELIRNELLKINSSGHPIYCRIIVIAKNKKATVVNATYALIMDSLKYKKHPNLSYICLNKTCGSFRKTAARHKAFYYDPAPEPTVRADMGTSV